MAINKNKTHAEERFSPTGKMIGITYAMNNGVCYDPASSVFH